MAPLPLPALANGAPQRSGPMADSPRPAPAPGPGPGPSVGCMAAAAAGRRGRSDFPESPGLRRRISTGSAVRQAPRRHSVRCGVGLLTCEPGVRPSTCLQHSAAGTLSVGTHARGWSGKRHAANRQQAWLGGGPLRGTGWGICHILATCHRGRHAAFGRAAPADDAAVVTFVRTSAIETR